MPSEARRHRGQERHNCPEPTVILQVVAVKGRRRRTCAAGNAVKDGKNDRARGRADAEHSKDEHAHDRAGRHHRVEDTKLVRKKVRHSPADDCRAVHNGNLQAAYRSRRSGIENEETYNIEGQ